MIYSRDEKGSEAGRIALSAKCEIRPLNSPQATVEGRMMGAKKSFAFEIFQGAGLRTYYLDAGSNEKKDLWMNCLQQAIQVMRQSGWPHGAQPGGPRY